MADADNLFRPETIDDARERLKRQTEGERESAKRSAEGQLTNKDLEDEEVIQGRIDEINESGIAMARAREMNTLDTARVTGPGRTSKPGEGGQPAEQSGGSGDIQRSAPAPEAAKKRGA